MKAPSRRFAASSCILLTLAFLAACGGENDAPFTQNTTGQTVNLSKALPASFAAHGSIDQLFVTDAAAGTTLELVSSKGSVLDTGMADSNGTLIFRDVTSGHGYVVVNEDGNTLWASNAVMVTDPHDAPSEDFYRNQTVNPGYGYITTRDGTTLAVNVILPGDVTDGPFPTVIEYSGYDPANPDSPQPSSLLANALGYAAVGINVRGSGCSGGAFKYFEPAQVSDGYDAIEVIAAQSWVKGNKVGMVGISYPGISQLFVAQLQPPRLAAIAPLSIISDSGRGVLYPGGILNNGFALDWTRDRQHDAMPGGQPWSQKRIDNGDQTCIDNQKLRGQTPDLVALVYENSYYTTKVSDPLAPVTFVDKINVPVFLAGAWQDEQTGGYFPTMLDRFTGTDKLHFTLTNGDHVDSLGPAIFSRWNEFLSFYVAGEIPQLPPTAGLILSALGSMVFGVQHLRLEPPRFDNAPSFEAALAQFESEQKVRILFDNGAGSNEPGAPVPGFEMSFDRWPIPGLTPTAWYFQEGGRLDSDKPPGQGADSYIYDPSAAQRTTIASSDDLQVWTALPPWDWRPLEPGKAVAYATDPLPETLVMAGSGSVDLWLQSTAPDVDLQVTLSEIRPNGQEVYVQNGWLRASHRKIDPAASSELRPVQTHRQEDAADLPSGTSVAARVELFPFAHVFRAGSRLRIAVEAPGGTRPRWKFDALPANGTVINTISRSATKASRIVLPVLPGVQVTTPLPTACPALRGQPCRTYQDYSNTPG